MLPLNKLLYLTLILSTTTTNSQPYMEESYHISTILNIENSEKEKPQPIEIKVGVNENYEELKRKQQAEKEDLEKKEKEIITAKEEMTKEEKKENPKKEEQKKTAEPVYEEIETYEEVLPEQTIYQEPIYEEETKPIKEEKPVYIEPVALNYQRVDANWVYNMALYYSYPGRYIGEEEDFNAIANLINYTIENYITGNMTTRDKLKTLKDVIAQYAVYDYEALNATNWTDYHSSFTAMGVVNGYATCSSFTEFYKFTAQALGIDVRTMHATLDSGLYHAWNVYYENGIRYNIDVTSESLNGIDDYYFMKTDSELANAYNMGYSIEGEY